MDTALVLQNLLSPAILFFFLGVFAVLLGSDLEIPAPLPKLFSLYLLLSIGFKGGVELQASGLGTEVLLTIGAALLMAVVVPLGCFGLLRTQFDVFNLPPWLVLMAPLVQSRSLRPKASCAFCRLIPMATWWRLLP